jgi:hypothetical protein
MIKSPFFIVEDAISPARCETLIAELGIKVPSFDEKNKNRPLRHDRIMRDAATNAPIVQLLQPHVSEIEDRYAGIVAGMESPLFQQYFENPNDPCEPHGCENAKFIRKKWVKSRDVDLVGFLWLKDYNGGVPLDTRFEVYGGKLEFAAYDFSLVPQRGTLVLFPAGPHFITAISPILVGSYEHVKVAIKLTTMEGGPWLYQPANFPGRYQDWFTPTE